MNSVTRRNSDFSVTAHIGDCKTLLAWNLPKAKVKNLAGFTVCYSFGQDQSFYLQNEWQFEHPEQHAQDPKYPPVSSINSPLHKFRWVHVPGSMNQGTKPFYGPYVYTVTPRYFDAKGHLQGVDASLSVQLPVDVGPFANGAIELGFTRGFVQSQAFDRHFGHKAQFKPPGAQLIFNTAQVSGTNVAGQKYTFAEEYEWLGFTARQKIFAILDEVVADKTLQLDMFAYDLNEPDILTRLLQLAEDGRIRLILDDAALHHANVTAKKAKSADSSKAKTAKGPPPEDQFESKFKAAAKNGAAIQRGKFGRFAHDKVFIVSREASDNKTVPIKVLAGSTNFSITGLYVNSNHVVVFNDPGVTAAYGKVFQDAWTQKVACGPFTTTPEATQVFSWSSSNLPKTDITYSPHTGADAQKRLDELTARVNQEAKTSGGSVLFAVMGLDKASGPILPALQKLHLNPKIFSYGISDSPGGIYLYSPRKTTGILVTGKPNATRLPAPFNQVPQIGLGHQVHHKFIVCGFNGKNPVVYCGSSNLALLGEQVNGDNLIAIYDGAVATAFAIEALALVDHFNFLDRFAVKTKTTASKVQPKASKQKQAVLAKWYEDTNDKWTIPYFDPNDLRSVDRNLFAGTP